MGEGRKRQYPLRGPNQIFKNLLMDVGLIQKCIYLLHYLVWLRGQIFVPANKDTEKSRKKKGYQNVIASECCGKYGGECGSEYVGSGECGGEMLAYFTSNTFPLNLEKLQQNIKNRISSD